MLSILFEMKSSMNIDNLPQAIGGFAVGLLI